MPVAMKPIILNIPVDEADTEYPIVIPENIEKFTMQMRDGTPFRFAFEMGKVDSLVSPYMTVKANASYSEQELQTRKVILYVACASGGKVVEVIAWK